MIILRQKEYSAEDACIGHADELVVPGREIQALRKLGYPKFYVDYLEKVNPLVSKYAKSEAGDEVIFARPMDEDSWDSGIADKFPGSEAGPYNEVKNGKNFVSLFFDNIFIAQDFGYSDSCVAIWYCVEDKNWYIKKGLFIKSYNQISNIKQYIMEKFNACPEIQKAISRL